MSPMLALRAGSIALRASCDETLRKKRHVLAALVLLENNMPHLYALIVRAVRGEYPAVAAILRKRWVPFDVLAPVIAEDARIQSLEVQTIPPERVDDYLAEILILDGRCSPKACRGTDIAVASS